MDEFRQSPPKNTEIRIDRVASFESDSASAHGGAGDAYRASFDSGIDSVPMAVVSTVAAATDTPPEELPPLQSVIDTDALDTLLQSRAVDELTFTYYGYTVIVHGDDGIAISRHDD